MSPKATKKYVSAKEVADSLGIFSSENQEGLYQVLNEQGYFWDSKAKLWYISGDNVQPASKVVKVRIWTSTNKVQESANSLKNQLSELGYELLEESRPYVCRPPNHLDSRIYLTFSPPDF